MIQYLKTANITDFKNAKYIFKSKKIDILAISISEHGNCMSFQEHLNCHHQRYRGDSLALTDNVGTIIVGLW